MHLVIKHKADRCYKNLQMQEEITLIILNKYIEVSKYDILLTHYSGSIEGLKYIYINLSNIAYMLLHYILLFLKSETR